MGSTISAVIRLRNNTNEDITSVLVHDVDIFDFGASRPDRMFTGTVPSNGCIEKTIDFSAFSSSCPFTTKLVFESGREDVFRLNYKCIFDGRETNLKHSVKSHKLEFKRTGPRVLEIVVKNTEEQLENVKAEELLSLGCRLLSHKRYSEASVKFMEAADKANEERTKQKVKKCLQDLQRMKESSDFDKKAKSLNNEGLKCLGSVQFHEALKKFDEALLLAKNSETISLIEDNLKIARDAKLNQDAKKLAHEALLLKKENSEAALQKFDEALRAATDLNIINSIKRHKAETLGEAGEETLQQAWFLELSQSQEAIHKFAKAKFFFQQAESVKNDSKYKKCIDIIVCKSEGDKYFNSGVQAENEGARLVEKTVKTENRGDCNLAREKYGEAWKCYSEAFKKYDEGWKKDGNFERGLVLAQQALQGVERILKEFEFVDL